MKKVFLLLIFMTIIGINIYAITDAGDVRITLIEVYQHYGNGDVRVITTGGTVFFNLNSSGGKAIFEILMKAYTEKIPVRLEYDETKQWPGTKGQCYEIYFVSLGQWR